MPIIKIEYDKQKFSDKDIRTLSEGLQKVASKASKLPLSDVSVYANKYGIVLNAAPIEIYVYVGSSFIPGGDIEKMLDTIARELKRFKKAHSIIIPLNISVVQMTWKFKLGI